MEGERRLLAIISGDVVNYTQRISEAEDKTVRALSEARDTIASLVVGHHGRLVDFVGDNFLAEFSSTQHALNCAVAIQKALLKSDGEKPLAGDLQFRIGAHVGDVRIEDGRLFGDGVNIAARLESLATAGGICLSKSMHDLMGAALEIPIEPGGAQRLKGFETPMEVFYISPAAVRGEKSGPSEARRRRYEENHGIPTLAVLPFNNLSVDPEQLFLAEGMTGDIISGLSCDKRLSVIAYNSVAQLQGTTQSVKELGESLNVQYLVQGSVRGTRNRIRFTVALLDAEREVELWSNKYDRAGSDVFNIMDEVVESMVITIASQLRYAEVDRFQRRRPATVDAWTLAMQAAHAFFANPSESLDAYLEMAAAAVELEPDYAFGLAVLGFLTAFKYPLGLSTDHKADVAKSLSATAQALELDSGDPMALTARAIALQYAGRTSESIEYLQRSLRRNPSYTLTHCYYGRGMMYAGKPELAIAHFEHFEKLTPDDPSANMAGMYHGLALMYLQRWEEAEQVARRANAAAGGRNPWIWTTLAIVVGALGRLDEARSALQELADVAPHWDRAFVDEFLSTCQEDPMLMAPISEILRKIWD